MQNHANKLMKALNGIFGNHKTKWCVFLFAFLIIHGGIHSQCNCPPNLQSYEVQANPNGYTNLDQTDFYSDNSSELVDGCVIVNGKLVVNEDYTLDNCLFFMQEGAEIEIRHDDLIVLNTAFEGCQTMWKGITLTGNTPKIDMGNSQVKDAQYAVLLDAAQPKVRLNTNFFDANYVGVAVNPIVWLISRIGNNNWIEDNNFIFNSPMKPAFAGQTPAPGSTPYAAVEINGYSGFKIGTGINSNIVNTIENIEHGVVQRGGGGDTYFSGLQISQPDQLYTDAIGVLVENAVGFVETNYNDFDDIPYGIYITGCNSYNEVNDNNMHACSYGVYVENNRGKVICDDNIMDRMEYGIYSTRSRNKDLTENTITASEACIMIREENRGDLLVGQNVLTAREDGIGIYLLLGDLNSDDAYEITDNDITVNAGIGILAQQKNGRINVNLNRIDFDYVQTTYYPNNAGIVFYESNGDATIEYNQVTIDSVYFGQVGIEISGLNSLMANAKKIHVVENVMTGNFYGAGILGKFSPEVVYCCNSTPATVGGGARFLGQCSGTVLSNTDFTGNAHTYPIGVAMIDAEIGWQVDRGNDFNTINALYDARFWGSGDPQNSRFVTNTTFLPNGLSKIRVPFPYVPGNWFFLTGSDNTCDSYSNICGVEPFEFGDNPNEHEVTSHDMTALDSVNDPNDPVQMLLKWELQRQLFNKLTHKPSLLTGSTELNTFYTNAQNSELGAYYDVQKGIAGLNAPPEPYASNADTAYNNIDNIINSIYAIDLQLPTATPQEEATLLAQKATLLQQLDTELANLANVEAQIAAWQAGEVAALQAANSALVATNSFQQHEKDINDVILSTIAQGTTTFTSAQQSLINTTAALCPNIEVRARSLKLFYAPGWIWLYDECVPTGGGQQYAVPDRPSSTTDRIEVFPNPAKSVITVRFNQLLETEAIISIYDLNGRTLDAETVARYTAKAVVNVGGLAPGIYLLEVNSDGQALLHERITIID